MEFTLRVTEEQAALIERGLAELPLKLALPTFKAVQVQLQVQLAQMKRTQASVPLPMGRQETEKAVESMQ